MKMVTVRVDDDQADKLDEIVRTQGITSSRSNVIRAMIDGVDVQPNGVWVATEYDAGECIATVHPDEVTALRRVVENGYGRVRFLRWGQTIREADAEAAGTEVP